MNNLTAKYELQELKKIIEEELGLTVDLLAYPYGDPNESIKRIASESGYRPAFGIGRGKWSLHNLRRIPVKEHESKLIFYMKAQGEFSLYTWFREQTIIGRISRKLRGKSE